MTALPVEAPRPSETYEGYEIFFVPVERGWYHRTGDGQTSVESYRSAFQARRAINLLLEARPTAKAARSAKQAS